jgi:hypothetical protein
VTRDHYLFIALSMAMPVIGWTIVYLSSRVERQRRERHAARFGDYPAAGRAPTRPKA